MTSAAVNPLVGGAGGIDPARGAGGHVRRDQVQSRTVKVLVSSQVLGGVGVASGIAVGAMLADQIAGSASLSGLAPTASALGAALAAVPLARLMTARGRRPGLAAGYLIGALGAVLVVVAAATRSYVLMLVGMTLFGAASATNLQARYAATDCATEGGRGRALSTVVWATTVGAVAGPNLSGVGGRTATWLHLPELSGPFVFSIASFVLGGLVIAVWLRPDPLVVARSGWTADEHRHARTSFRDSMAVIRRSPPALLGLVTIAVAQAVMVGVMSMTPVHMRHHGATLTVVGVVISVHIAGMYALSPVVGALSDRFGRVPVILAGQGILLLAFVVAASAGPHDAPALGAGLLLLGLGWSFGLVAGSTLLSESVADAVRPGVQGASDFVMSASGALGGVLAGVVVGTLGYLHLNLLACLVVAPVVVLALRARARGGRGGGGLVDAPGQAG